VFDPCDGIWKSAFWLTGALILLGAVPAGAQDYSAGKTPAQLFQSDCAACHKSPHGLAKGRDVRALSGFLREHYTTKAESAGALAAYLAGVGGGPAESKPRPGAKSKLEPAGAEQEEQGRRKPYSSATAAPVANEGKPAVRAHRAVAPGSSQQENKPNAKAEAKPEAEAKPGEADAKPPRRAARAARPAERGVAATEEKLKGYAASGEGAAGTPKKDDVSAPPGRDAKDPAKTLESYATSGTPATPSETKSGGTPAAADKPAAPQDGAVKASAAEEDAVKEGRQPAKESSAQSEAAAPEPASQAAMKPRSKHKKQSVDATAADSAAASPQPTPRRTHPRTPVAPPPGNN
jgi:hypothetical protein